MVSVKELMKSIHKNPNLYAKKFLQIRIAIINTFPYSIYYQSDTNTKTIVIFAVIHQSRSEKVWENRIE